MNKLKQKKKQCLFLEANNHSNCRVVLNGGPYLNLSAIEPNTSQLLSFFYHKSSNNMKTVFNSTISLKKKSNQIVKMDIHLLQIFCFKNNFLAPQIHISEISSC